MCICLFNSLLFGFQGYVLSPATPLVGRGHTTFGGGGLRRPQKIKHGKLHKERLTLPGKGAMWPLCLFTLASCLWLTVKAGGLTVNINLTKVVNPNHFFNTRLSFMAQAAFDLFAKSKWKSKNDGEDSPYPEM